MNFGEKLYNLRKQNGLSQEELSEKLNVTRQTVSKWELNQSKPDTDKMQEICSLFNVTIDELTNEKVSLNKKKNKDDDEDHHRTWLLWVLVVIAVIIAVILSLKVASDRKNRVYTNNDTTRINDISNTQKKVEIDIFNSPFEMYVGTEWGTNVSDLLDKIITNNKKNTDRQLTVVYGTTDTTDPETIKELKKKFEKWTDYEVSVDYNEEGYIYKITIEDYNKKSSSSNSSKTNQTNSSNSSSNTSITANDDFDKKAFNSSVEFRAGESSGFFIKSMLDFVVQNNNSNSEHKLFVKYNGVTYNDSESIKTLKNSFNDFSEKKYDVTVSYGSDGYANGYTIK